jgi:hypothetical protein
MVVMLARAFSQQGFQIAHCHSSETKLPDSEKRLATMTWQTQSEQIYQVYSILLSKYAEAGMFPFLPTITEQQ